MCWNKACNFQLLRKLKDSGMNWNRLCDPTGRPTPTASVVALGGIFFLLGAVLIAVSIWAFVMVL